MSSMEDEKWVYWRNKAQRLEEENRQLKEEIEQYKAVIDKKWSEYLKKHEMIQNDWKIIEKGDLNEN